MLFPFLDLVALTVCSVILDVEPLLVLLLNLGGPLHGISHTYLVATLVAIIVKGALWRIRNTISSLVAVLGIRQESKKVRLLLASLFGSYSHVFMDSFIYHEMNPFFPIPGNPFLGLIAAFTIYQFCIVCGALGLLLYFVRFCVLTKKAKYMPIETPW